MKIGRVQYGDHQGIAIVTERGTFRGTSLAKKMGTPLGWNTLREMLNAGERAREIVQEWSRHAVMAEWEPDPEPMQGLAPVTDAQTVICVGLNYRPHAVESGMEIPTHPVLFNKYANALVGIDKRKSRLGNAAECPLEKLDGSRYRGVKLPKKLLRLSAF